MNVCFGEALILAVHSCPAWPRDKDLPNVPAQADNLKKVFQDLGLNVTRPQQEELTNEGVKRCVADLCRRTSDKLKTIKEDALFVAVAVLSHGRLSDSFSELPAMVCYDSLGVLDASNDADLDGILLSGFNSIEVPVGKRLKVWLILDCCQSNEHLSTWRGPAANLEMKRLRRTFGCPSSVDFMTLLSCDPGRESHDIYSMSRALAEVLEPKKPILLHVACESAMKSVEVSTNGMVRPSLKQRGDFSSLHLFSYKRRFSYNNSLLPVPQQLRPQRVHGRRCCFQGLRKLSVVDDYDPGLSAQLVLVFWYLVWSWFRLLCCEDEGIQRQFPPPIREQPGVDTEDILRAMKTIPHFAFMLWLCFLTALARIVVGWRLSLDKRPAAFGVTGFGQP